MPITNRQSYWMGTTPPELNKAVPLVGANIARGFPTSGELATPNMQLPLTRELFFSYVPNVHGAAYNYGKLILPTVTGSQKFLPGSAGPGALKVNNTTPGLFTWAPYAKFNKQGTFLAYFIPNTLSSSDSTGRHISYVYNTEWGGGYGTGIIQAPYLDRQQTSAISSPPYAGTTNYGQIAQVVNGNLQVVVMRIICSTLCEVYIDGGLVGSTTATPTTSLAAYNTGTRVVQGDNNTYTNDNGTIFMSAIWSRALSPDEIRQVSANPWQLFKHPRPTGMVPL